MPAAAYSCIRMCVCVCVLFLNVLSDYMCARTVVAAAATVRERGKWYNGKRLIESPREKSDRIARPYCACRPKQSNPFLPPR